ncbi:MAG: hypothetical protein VB135_03250 [Burkholderia sp.]
MDDTDMVTPRATSNVRKRVLRFKRANPASVAMHLNASTTDNFNGLLDEIACIIYNGSLEKI